MNDPDSFSFADAIKHFFFNYDHGTSFLPEINVGRTGYPFQRRCLERGIILRTHESSPLL